MFTREVHFPDDGSNRSNSAVFLSADRNRPPIAYTQVTSETAARCSRGIGMSPASFQEFPSNTSVCGTIFLSFCPPTTTSFSPTTAAAPPARAWPRGGKSTQLPPRNAYTLFDACAMLSVAPPITTTSPRYVAAVAWCNGIGKGGCVCHVPVCGSKLCTVCSVVPCCRPPATQILPSSTVEAIINRAVGASGKDRHCETG